MLVRTRACVYVREGDGGRRREFTVCDVWFEGKELGKRKEKVVIFTVNSSLITKTRHLPLIHTCARTHNHQSPTYMWL